MCLMCDELKTSVLLVGVSDILVIFFVVVGPGLLGRGVDTSLR